jgi:hypothetical protein
MSSESTGSDRLRWLLQPPATGGVHLRVGIGDGAELTPQVQAALEELISSLQQVDVDAVAKRCFPKCPLLKGCGVFDCDGYHNCNLGKGPCLVDIVCVIED